MIKNKLYIMCVGLPYSGKSTFFNQLLEKIPEIKRIDTDSYIENVAKRKKSTYNQEFKSSIKRAKKYMNQMKEEYSKEGYSIFHDQTNLTKSARQSKLKSVPSDYYKIALVFHTPLSTIQERFYKRPEKPISFDIFERMALSSESLETEDENGNIIYEKGFNEIINISDTNESISSAIERIVEMYENGYFYIDLKNTSNVDEVITQIRDITSKDIEISEEIKKEIESLISSKSN